MNPTVEEVVRNVKTGVRTTDELKKCGCGTCKKALKQLEA